MKNRNIKDRKYRIFTTYPKAWAGMLAAIEVAQKNIYLEMYILDDDSAGVEFFRELEAAARRGVKVVVILDVVGSFNMFDRAVDGLVAAGAEVLFSSFLFQRLHRKVLIVDESTAFIGGVNVGKKFARWKDLQIQVTGKVVSAVVRSFARMYKKCGGKKDLVPMTFLAESGDPRHGVIVKVKTWFIDHGVGKRRHLFRRFYEGRIDHAKLSIVLVTPYLFPPRWFIARLHQAMIRGVRVEILLPESTDYLLVDSVNRSFATSLTELGATCYFTKGMNHAKAMLVDRREGVIGSQNLDMFSFNFNIEAGVSFDEPDMVRDLAKIIDDWKAEAIVKTAPPSKKFKSALRWYDIPMAFFLRFAGFVPME